MAQLDWLIISPSGGDDTSTIAQAISDLAANGGGEVILKNGTYTVTSPISLVSGVKVRGAGYATTNASTLVSGTIMQGNGTASCFVVNEADTTAPADLAEIYAESVFGTGLSGMAFTNFVTPVHIGALNASGCFYSEFRDLYVTNCTGWGFYFENTSLSNFTNLTVRNMASGATGGMMFRSSHLPYNHGNCSYRYLFVETNQNLTRGIVFQARNLSTFNDNNIFHIQCNAGGQFVSQAATMSAASADITVTDGTQFPVDMPVTVSATANGFNTLETYFVVSQVGNVIQLAEEQGETATPTLATGSTAVNIVSHGFPGVEVCGYGPEGSSGSMQPTVMTGVDIEGSQSCGMLWQNARVIADFNLLPNDQGVTSGDVCFSSIVFRGDATGTYRSLSTFTAVDIQNHYKALYNLGTKVNFNTYPSSIVQEAPLGMYYDGGGSQSYFTMAGNLMGGKYSLKSITALSGSFIYPNQTLGQRCTYRTNDADYTITHYSSGSFVWIPGATTTNRTWTLPVLNDGVGGTSTSVGIPFEITNGCTSTANLTISANTGDYFNNQSAKTAIVLAPGDTVFLRAQYNGSVSFWQVLSYTDHSALP